VIGVGFKSGCTNEGIRGRDVEKRRPGCYCVKGKGGEGEIWRLQLYGEERKQEASQLGHGAAMLELAPFTCQTLQHRLSGAVSSLVSMLTVHQRGYRSTKEERARLTTPHLAGRSCATGIERGNRFTCLNVYRSQRDGIYVHSSLEKAVRAAFWRRLLRDPTLIRVLISRRCCPFRMHNPWCVGEQFDQVRVRDWRRVGRMEGTVEGDMVLIRDARRDVKICGSVQNAMVRFM
jgi:hypothetical protein